MHLVFCWGLLGVIQSPIICRLSWCGWWSYFLILLVYLRDPLSHIALYFRMLFYYPCMKNTSTLVSAVTQLKMKLLNRNIQRLFNSISWKLTCFTLPETGADVSYFLNIYVTLFCRLIAQPIPVSPPILRLFLLTLALHIGAAPPAQFLSAKFFEDVFACNFLGRVQSGVRGPHPLFTTRYGNWFFFIKHSKVLNVAMATSPSEIGFNSPVHQRSFSTYFLLREWQTILFTTQDENCFFEFSSKY